MEARQPSARQPSQSFHPTARASLRRNRRSIRHPRTHHHRTHQRPRIILAHPWHLCHAPTANDHNPHRRVCPPRRDPLLGLAPPTGIKSQPPCVAAPFSPAGIEDARLLSADRKAVAELLQAASKDGKLYRRDTAITELKALAEQRGLDTGTGNYDLTNPAAERRIALVIDTNRAQAQGYARFKRSSTGGALLAFPCQELIRIPRLQSPPRLALPLDRCRRHPLRWPHDRPKVRSNLDHHQPLRHPLPTT